MADKQHPLQRILLAFQNRKAFLKAYVDDKKTGILRMADRPDLSPGDAVDIEIAFADDLMVFRTKGTVVDRIESDKSASSELRIAFLKSENKTRTLLLEYAEGRSRHSLKRRSRRFFAKVQLEYATEDQPFRKVWTEDLNKDGAFLLTDQILDAGTLVVMRLFPENQEPITITGEVAWRRNAHPRGFAVRFLVGEPAKLKEIEKLVTLVLQTRTKRAKQQR